MKLKQIISEVTTAEPAAIWSHVKSIGQSLLAPSQKRKSDVNYQKAAKSAVSCNTCQAFNKTNNTCLKVQGLLNKDAVCDLWKKSTSATPTTPTTPTTP